MRLQYDRNVQHTYVPLKKYGLNCWVKDQFLAQNDQFPNTAKLSRT